MNTSKLLWMFLIILLLFPGCSNIQIIRKYEWRYDPKDYINPKFSAEDFNDQYPLEKICKTIKDDRYDLSLKNPENTVAWLNELLEVPDFYDSLVNKKQDMKFSKYTTKLVNKTRNYRNRNFSKLDSEKKDTIRRLNRLILEESYPDIPKSNFDDKLKKDIERLFVMHKYRWWNYYNRALEFMKYGFWEEAIKDYATTVYLHDKDEISAKTYGVNQIELFANREMGIILSIIANYDDALEDLKSPIQDDKSPIDNTYLIYILEDILNLKKDSLLKLSKEEFKIQIKKASFELLKKSFDSVESDKTLFYLKELFNDKEIQNIVNIKNIYGPTIIYKAIGKYPYIRLKIKVIDSDSLVDIISINDEELFVNLGKKEFEFIHNMKLREGLKEIRIMAKNYFGKKSFGPITLKEENLSGKIFEINYPQKTKLKTKNKTKPILLAQLNDTILKSATDSNVGNSNSNGTINKQVSVEYDPKVHNILDNNILPILQDAEDRYRIALLPFEFGFGSEEKIDSKKLDDAIKELYKAMEDILRKERRFYYVEIDNNINKLLEKLKNIGLSYGEFFDKKRVRESLINIVDKDNNIKIDGFLIGKIGRAKIDNSNIPKIKGLNKQIEIKWELYAFDKKTIGPRIIPPEGVDIQETDNDKLFQIMDNLKLLPTSAIAKDLIQRLNIKFPVVSYGTINFTYKDGFISDLSQNILDYNILKNLKVIIYNRAGRNEEWVPIKVECCDGNIRKVHKNKKEDVKLNIINTQEINCFENIKVGDIVILK